MTPDEFRSLALGLPDAVESSHMDHPDFRVGGKIFATLGYPGVEWGVVMLSPDEAARVRKAEPEVFVAAKDAWGRAGSTQVLLGKARKEIVRKALRSAWQYRMEKNGTVAKKKPSRRVGRFAAPG